MTDNVETLEDIPSTGSEISEQPKETSRNKGLDDVRQAYEQVVKKAQDKAAADKKETDDKPARTRDERGQFASNIKNESQHEPEPRLQEQSKAETNTEANNKPVRRPPPGFSPQSKHYYDNLPDFVKDDIAKREEEISKGFAETQPRLEKYKNVEKYVEMAEKSGTTLDKALDQYVGLETLLRRDVFAGVEQVLQNLGVNPRSFAQAYLNRVSGNDQKLQNNSSYSPDQKGNGLGQYGDQKPIDPQAIIQQAKDAIKAELEERQVQEEIGRMANDPKYKFFHNVRPKMAQLVQAGLAKTFQEAYDQACMLDPDIRTLLNNNANSEDSKRAAVDKARSVSKATIGSRAAQTAPNLNIKKGSPTMAIIEAEVARQKGQFG